MQMQVGGAHALRVEQIAVCAWNVNPVPRFIPFDESSNGTSSRGLGEEPFGMTTPFLPTFTPFQQVGTGFTGEASPWYGVNKPATLMRDLKALATR